MSSVALSLLLDKVGLSLLNVKDWQNMSRHFCVVFGTLADH